MFKKLLKWANKKQNNFNIYNLTFLKKIKKKTSRYHYQNLNDIIYSSWHIEQNILKLVILGHFLSYYPLKLPKTKILKNEEICWRYHHYTHAHQKSQSYHVRFLRYGVRQTEFFVILDCFLPFYPPMDLKYGVQWTEFFVVFDHFFPFACLTTQKIKILRKWNTA